MAYINQEKKATMMPAFKAAFAKYGVKGSVSIRHSSTLIVTISSGPMRELSGFDGEELSWYLRTTNERTPPAQNPQIISMINELLDIANEGNWDESDTQTDYFNVGWYVEVRAGRWNKPFVFTEK